MRHSRGRYNTIHVRCSLWTVSHVAHELKYTEETSSNPHVEDSQRSPIGVRQHVCTGRGLASPLRCEPGNSLSPVPIAKLKTFAAWTQQHTRCAVGEVYRVAHQERRVARIHSPCDSGDMATTSAAQLRRQQQQQVGLNVCWQQYCSLRQGVLEAAHATGHPTSNISKLDAQLEAVSSLRTISRAVQYSSSVVNAVT